MLHWGSVKLATTVSGKIIYADEVSYNVETLIIICEENKETENVLSICKSVIFMTAANLRQKTCGHSVACFFIFY